MFSNMGLSRADLTVMREDVNDIPTIIIENLVPESTGPTSSVFEKTRGFLDATILQTDLLLLEDSLRRYKSLTKK